MHYDLVAIARDVAVREGFVVDFPRVTTPRTTTTRTTRRTQPSSTRRACPWSSIDNRESTDLDQIEVSERLPGGVIRVKLGIADVDTFIPRGSELDVHAARNTTSLYAGYRDFSDAPGRPVEWRVVVAPERRATLRSSPSSTSQQDGSTSHDTRVYRARVKNHAKLVYDDVGGWLEGHDDHGPHGAHIAEQVHGCRTRLHGGLRKQSHRARRAPARDGRGARGRVPR